MKVTSIRKTAGGDQFETVAERKLKSGIVAGIEEDATVLGKKIFTTFRKG